MHSAKHMSKTDWKAILIIGAGVGLLIQPILANNLAAYRLGFAVQAGVFLFFVAFAPFALWMFRLLSKKWQGLYEFAKFAAVGTLNSFIDIGVLNLETFLYGSTMMSNTVFAVFKAVSFLFATTNSFLWNKYWTFSANSTPKTGEVASFYTVAVIGWALNVGVATLVKAFGPVDSKTWITIVAPLAGVAASFLWDFFGYKYFVFRKEGASAPQA